MDLKKYLKEKNVSVRKLSIITSLPYTTVYDIVNGNVKMEDCQYKTLKPIATFCQVSVDELVYHYVGFQTFRSELHHRLVKEDELDVVADLLQSRAIDYYYENGDNAKALYLLSLVDHMLKKYDLPLCAEYSFLRNQKLKEPLFIGDSSVEKNAEECISEFVQHNIFEGDLYDAA